MNNKKQRQRSHGKLLPQLGNITAQQFLDEYWQKKPLLIRGAFPKTFAPLTKTEIFKLAGYEDAESRMVLLSGNVWRVDHGPFSGNVFRMLAKNTDARWTVLIQDTQHFSHQAQTLLEYFNFLPQTRLDDLMVSYAVKGGGVGPHFDSYDVFLLQGVGRRCWQISSQQDLALKPDVPLKILQRFRVDEEWVLDEGDMLYLPPSYAHNGVAETGDCVTWSIGFRSPSNQELLDAYVDDLRDRLKAEGRFADPIRKATSGTDTAAIDTQLQAAFGNTLGTALSNAIDPAAINEFIGRYLSQPKPHVTFDPPEIKLTLAAFKRRAISKRANGIILDLRSRLLFDDNHFFLNGESLTIPRADRALVTDLAGTRRLESKIVKSASSKLFEVLYMQWQRGYLHFADL